MRKRSLIAGSAVVVAGASVLGCGASGEATSFELPSEERIYVGSEVLIDPNVSSGSLGTTTVQWILEAGTTALIIDPSPYDEEDPFLCIPKQPEKVNNGSDSELTRFAGQVCFKNGDTSIDTTSS